MLVTQGGQVLRSRPVTQQLGLTRMSREGDLVSVDVGRW
jgi:hypothetical protein